MVNILKKSRINYSFFFVLFVILNDGRKYIYIDMCISAFEKFTYYSEFIKV